MSWTYKRRGAKPSARNAWWAVGVLFFILMGAIFSSLDIDLGFIAILSLYALGWFVMPVIHPLLLLSEEGIEYHLWHAVLFASWDDVAGIDEKGLLIEAGQLQVHVLGRIGRPGWQRTSRANHPDFVPFKHPLRHQPSINISLSADNWQETEIGHEIKKYVPELFEYIPELFEAKRGKPDRPPT